MPLLKCININIKKLFGIYTEVCENLIIIFSYILFLEGGGFLFVLFSTLYSSQWGLLNVRQ